ncbi:MAG: hypothetical protein WDM81_13895 [Rhizomicrobium sp.]
MANGLSRMRGARPAPDTADDGREIQDPGAAPGAAAPPPRDMPVLDTFNDRQSFHRNRRAIAELGELMGRADAIIGAFERKSGDIEAGHRHIKIVAKECARLLRSIDARTPA